MQIEIGSNQTTMCLSKANIIEAPTPIQDSVVKIKLLNSGLLVPNELITNKIHLYTTYNIIPLEPDPFTIPLFFHEILYGSDI